MKDCIKCETEKELIEFSRKRSSKDGYQSDCKLCASEYKKQNYKRNRKQIRERIVKRYKENKKWFISLKENMKCYICSENETVCLDFHHKDPKTKRDDVSQLVADGCSKKTILEEIEKCIVYCANCHRKFHAGVM